MQGQAIAPTPAANAPSQHSTSQSKKQKDKKTADVSKQTTPLSSQQQGTQQNLPMSSESPQDALWQLPPLPKSQIPLTNSSIGLVNGRGQQNCFMNVCLQTVANIESVFQDLLKQKRMQDERRRTGKRKKQSIA